MPRIIFGRAVRGLIFLSVGREIHCTIKIAGVECGSCGLRERRCPLFLEFIGRIDAGNIVRKLGGTNAPVNQREHWLIDPFDRV